VAEERTMTGPDPVALAIYTRQLDRHDACIKLLGHLLENSSHVYSIDASEKVRAALLRAEIGKNVARKLINAWNRAEEHQKMHACRRRKDVR
jgi:hypothetical protein